VKAKELLFGSDGATRERCAPSTDMCALPR
jgi:hypothetical protein